MSFNALYAGIAATVLTVSPLTAADPGPRDEANGSVAVSLETPRVGGFGAFLCGWCWIVS